jgi:hypothetical protein
MTIGASPSHGVGGPKALTDENPKVLVRYVAERTGLEPASGVTVQSSGRELSNGVESRE